MRIQFILVAVGASLIHPPSVFGQPRLESELKANETVWVTTSDGRTEQGRFRMWSGSSLEWDAPTGPVRTPFEQIGRIEARDPIHDGGTTGAVLGAGFGAFGSLLVNTSGDNPNPTPTEKKIKYLLGGAAFGAGVGTVMGLAFDYAFHTRRLVYAKTTGQARVRFTPAIGGGKRLGAAATMSW